jgi:tRNA1Val (adenine37-N6)-methyltransferase
MFRFKQFNVDQAGCAMKINTDGVLVGALAGTHQPATILDIGTGTGVIALMLAQRFENARVDSVEIDEAAAATARRNFEGSPFAGRLRLYAEGFEKYLSSHSGAEYDLIVSNPPFYINALESPGEKRTLAKHTDERFFITLIGLIPNHLTPSGEFWLILPLQTAQLVKAAAGRAGLKLKQTISISSYPHSEPHREIMVLTLNNERKPDERFVIYEAPKVYSKEYEAALRPFFTIF